MLVRNEKRCLPALSIFLDRDLASVLAAMLVVAPAALAGGPKLVA